MCTWIVRRVPVWTRELGSDREGEREAGRRGGD